MKITFGRVLNALILIGVVWTLCLAFRETTWYTSKYNPAPVSQTGGGTVSLLEFEELLESITPDDYLYPDAQKVLAKIAYYESLLDAYLNETLSERTIDFIGEIHQHPMQESDSRFVQDHKDRVESFLAQNPVQVFGVEGYSSEFVTREGIQAEFDALFAKVGRSADPALVDYVVSKSPALSAGFSRSTNLVVGLEDKVLHDFVIVLLEVMTYSTDKRLRFKYEQIFKASVYLRTEIAVARMNKVMRRHQLDLGVIVQGDLHRYQFLKLKKLYRIPGLVESTIPEKDREPITVSEFFKQMK